jgi:malate/lactate dehydrogenase
LEVNIPAVMEKLEAVVMELVDCAYPLLTECVATSDISVAFHAADVVIFLGAMPRK